jgi:hypothetical protein
LILSSNGILKGKGELASRSPRYDGNVETGTRPLPERADEDREDEPFPEDFCEFTYLLDWEIVGLGCLF